MPLPSTEEEVWRYSRIDELDLDRYQPAPSTTTVSHGDLGRARVARASELDDGEEIVDGLSDPTSALGWLRAALPVDPVVIDVPAGVHLGQPVVVRHEGAGDGLAVATSVVVRAGADSSVRVVEVLSGGGAGLVLPATDVVAAQAARVGYVGAQDLSRDGWMIGTLELTAEAQATVTAGLAGFGGDYARLRTDCHLVGRGATGDLLAAYFGIGAQSLDYRTFQEHGAPDTTSNLLFKGAVGDQARSVYTGLIRVAKEIRERQRDTVITPS